MPSPKKFSVSWAKTAVVDLDSIIDFLAGENIDAAERVLGKIHRTVSRLTLFPYRGRVVPELKECGIVTYHEMICAPWRIVYRIEGRTVFVMAVIDGRRNFEDLLLERFLYREVK